MLAVGFVAVDVALIRAMFPPGNPPSGVHLIILGPGLVVSGSILMFPLVLGLGPLVRTRRVAGSFLAGFQFAGWGVLGLLLLLGFVGFDGLIQYSAQVSQPLEAGIEPVVRALGESGQILGFAIMALVFTIPTMGVAVLGGLATRRLGVVMEVRVGRPSRTILASKDQAATGESQPDL